MRKFKIKDAFKPAYFGLIESGIIKTYHIQPKDVIEENGDIFNQVQVLKLGHWFEEVEEEKTFMFDFVPIVANKQQQNIKFVLDGMNEHEYILSKDNLSDLIYELGHPVVNFIGYSARADFPKLKKDSIIQIGCKKDKFGILLDILNYLNKYEEGEE